MVNGCKRGLVHPPRNGKLLHLTNGLVIIPNPSECVEATGAINIISTPDKLNAVLTIPSVSTNLSTDEQQTRTLQRVRTELQDVPTLEATPQLIKKNWLAKYRHITKCTAAKNSASSPHSWLNTLSEMVRLFAFTLWMMGLILASICEHP